MSHPIPTVDITENMYPDDDFSSEVNDFFTNGIGRIQAKYTQSNFAPNLEDIDNI